MSVLKKKCAKCGDDDCRLFGCSKCRLVSYCGEECQNSHWGVHKKYCKLSLLKGELMSVSGHLDLVDEGANTTMVEDMNRIFNITSPEVRSSAVDEFIRETKEQRKLHIACGNYVGVAGSSLALAIIYMKNNYFTDAKTAIIKCVANVADIDAKVLLGTLQIDSRILEELKISLEWNHVVIDTMLIKASNDIEMKEIRNMVEGPDRTERSFKLVKNFMQEQTYVYKLKNYDQCIVIDMRCVALANVIATTPGEFMWKGLVLFKNRLKHGDYIVAKHGSELRDTIVEAYMGMKEDLKEVISALE